MLCIARTAAHQSPISNVFDRRAAGNTSPNPSQSSQSFHMQYFGCLWCLKLFTTIIGCVRNAIRYGLLHRRLEVTMVPVQPAWKRMKRRFCMLIPRAYGALCNNLPVSLEKQMYFSVIRIFPFCALLDIWNSWKFTPYSFYTKNTNISQYFLFPKEAHRQFQLLHTPPYWISE